MKRWQYLKKDKISEGKINSRLFYDPGDAFEFCVFCFLPVSFLGSSGGYRIIDCVDGSDKFYPLVGKPLYNRLDPEGVL